jgi:hypothetical protein
LWFLSLDGWRAELDQLSATDQGVRISAWGSDWARRARGGAGGDGQVRIDGGMVADGRRTEVGRRWPGPAVSGKEGWEQRRSRHGER